jgi:hypothetical protein
MFDVCDDFLEITLRNDLLFEIVVFSIFLVEAIPMRRFCSTEVYLYHLFILMP